MDLVDDPRRLEPGEALPGALAACLITTTLAKARGLLWGPLDGSITQACGVLSDRGGWAARVLGAAFPVGAVVYALRRRRRDHSDRGLPRRSQLGQRSAHFRWDEILDARHG